MRKRDKEGKLSLLGDLRQNKELYVMMTPFFVLFAFMTLSAIGAAVWYSFTYYNLFDAPVFVGLKNYEALLLDDEIFGIAVRNTLLFSLITGPIGYLLCFFLAWLVNEFGTATRVLLTFCFYAPSLTGASVFFIWKFLFSGDAYGFLNGLLLSARLITEPVQWLTNQNINFWVLIFVQLWMSLGTGFLAFVAGFKGVDPSLYEAGSIDGIANRMQELMHITLPMMKPQLLFGAIMQISASFSVSTLSTQLIGQNSTNYSGHTIVLHMIDYGTVRYEMGYACAVAVVLFMMMLVFKTVVTFILRYINDDE